MEPIAGQFMFDFTRANRVITSTAVPKTGQKSVQENQPDVSRDDDASDLFGRAIALEDDPNNQLQAIALYERVVDLDPDHAAAHINLGTLHYNRQNYTAAEEHYRAAIKIDPRYALAYFDLGNVLDETGRVTEAVKTYTTALQLAPTYADAHYNLALAHEKLKQPRSALRHWRAYVKLDTAGPWAMHARNQIQRILQADGLRLMQGGKRN